MLKSGALNAVDIVSFHPYALHPDGVMRRIEAVRSLISSYGFTGQLWITEIGYPSRICCSSPRGEARQAEYAVKILLGAALRDISTILWYELIDADPNEQTGGFCGIEKHYGITRFDHIYKAAAHAFSLVARYVPGSRYSPDLLTIEAALHGKIEILPFVTPFGTTALFLWARRIEAIRLYIDGEVADLIEHELYTGESRPFAQREGFELTHNPRLLTFSSQQGPVKVRVYRVNGGSR